MTLHFATSTAVENEERMFYRPLEKRISHIIDKYYLLGGRIGWNLKWQSGVADAPSIKCLQGLDDGDLEEYVLKWMIEEK